MSEAANAGATLAVQVFKSFVDRDPDLEPDRPAYHSFVRDYLDVRLIAGISRKLRGCPDLVAYVQQLVSVFERPVPRQDYQRLEDEASMAIFSSKAQLMKLFRQRVEQLGRVIRGGVTQ